MSEILINGYSVNYINNLKSNDHFILNSKGDNYLVSYRYRYLRYVTSEIALFFKRLFNCVRSCGTWETDKRLLNHVIVEINKDIEEAKKPNLTEEQKNHLQSKHDILIRIKNNLLAHISGRVLGYIEKNELFSSDPKPRTDSSSTQNSNEGPPEMNSSVGLKTEQTSIGTASTENGPKKIVGVVFDRNNELCEYLHSVIKDKFPNVEFVESPCPNGKKFKVSLYYAPISTSRVKGFTNPERITRCLNEAASAVVMCARAIKYPTIHTDSDITNLGFDSAFDFYIYDKNFDDPEGSNNKQVETLRQYLETKW